MLTACTWLWGDKYGLRDVKKLRAGLARNIKQPFRFICFATRDAIETAILSAPVGALSRPSNGGVFICGVEFRAMPPEDEEMTYSPGCFARLRMFDPDWQARHSINERLVCYDLDVVVTGEQDALLNRAETFMILQGANASNPCPYNGSVMMLRAGAHPEVWRGFDFEREISWPMSASEGRAAGDRAGSYSEFPDDQGYLAHVLPNASGWKAGPQSGVYAFCKPGWPAGGDKAPLPADARLVVFPGWRSPAQFSKLGWVQEHWRA